MSNNQHKLSKEKRESLKKAVSESNADLLKANERREEIQKFLNDANGILMMDKHSGRIGKPFRVAGRWNQLFLLKGFSGDFLLGILVEYNASTEEVIRVEFENHWKRIDDIGKEPCVALWNKLAKQINDKLTIK